jgi:hypothetical protein
MIGRHEEVPQAATDKAQNMIRAAARSRQGLDAKNARLRPPVPRRIVPARWIGDPPET